MNNTELKEKIEQMEKELAELKKTVKENDEPKFERTIGKTYYYIDFGGDAGTVAVKDLDCDNKFSKNMFIQNNYFHTKERAEDVTKKVKMLLKLERLHDTFCPDYVPNWDCFDENKYYVYYDNDVEFYKCSSARICKQNDVYFSTYEIAREVCNIFNGE